MSSQPHPGPIAGGCNEGYCKHGELRENTRPCVRISSSPPGDRQLTLRNESPILSFVRLTCLSIDSLTLCRVAIGADSILPWKETNHADDTRSRATD